MSNYLKYSIFTTVRLTQVHETINQLNTLKCPTKMLKEIKEQLEFIENDFPITIELLNSEAEKYNKIYENHNAKNIQLYIDFY